MLATAVACSLDIQHPHPLTNSPFMQRCKLKREFETSRILNSIKRYLDCNSQNTLELPVLYFSDYKIKLQLD